MKRITVKTKPYDVIETLLEQAVRGAVYQTWKHRSDPQPADVVTDVLAQNISTYFWSAAKENGVTFE